MNPIRSVHIIGSRDLGGAERFYLRLVLALHARGHGVIAVNRAGSGVDRELGDRVPQAHAAMSNQWDILSRWRISRLLRAQRPDIVQTFMTRATVLTHVKRGQGPVHIARLGGYYKVARFRHAHAWIGNTRGICDFLVREGLPRERVFYIGNFVGTPAPAPAEKLAALREALVLPPGARVLFAAGRLTYKKGFDVLLEAFAALPCDIGGAPLCLVIAGDGPLRAELARHADRLGIAARVRWAGWQTDPAPYYDLADLFVCPSRHEPLGNVILEAWSHGRPVLSTATVGARELVRHGEDGWLVPGEDPHALRYALTRLLEDAALCAALAEAGRRKVQAEFSERAVVEAYEDLYRRLLASD